MQIVQDRQALHQIPETDRELPKTLAYITHSLEGLPCRVFSPAKDSLCAFFDFGADSALAFRADMDALPIAEKTGLPFASCHPGKMHACGHDGHMAILLELARRLSKKQHCKYNVLLVFQPAEETDGGAKAICDTGIFEQYRVRAIFGLHLWPGVKAGVIASRRGPLMSHSCDLAIDIYGKSAHIAKAGEGIDALAAAVEFYQRVCQIEQGMPENIFRLLKFGKLHSGTVGNALSAHSRLEGSLRAFQEDIFDSLQNTLTAVGRDVERLYGCQVVIHRNEGYPAVTNPDGLYTAVRAIADFEDLPKPSMTAEDFSWYQQYVPGMFFFLGVGDTPPLHADTFDFDPEVLETGADFFEQLLSGSY